MQQLMQTWWFGGLVVPLIISLFTGYFCSAIVARYFLFTQEIQRARERVLSLTDKIHAMAEQPSAEEAEVLVTWLLIEPATSLKLQQGQVRACNQLLKLSGSVQNRALHLSAQLREIAKNPPRDEAQILAKITPVNKEIKALVFDTLNQLTTIRIEFFPVIGAPTFASWYRKSRHLSS
jgi:flagellar biosynthesis/type III secretory pathway M-ring protein FliF/YscJ